MKFKIEKIKRLYKIYYRLHIIADEKRYNTYIDIEPNEFKQLKERINSFPMKD